MKQAKKKKPQDLTLRNLRALKKLIEAVKKHFNKILGKKKK
jgi:hypothetical protein